MVKRSDTIKFLIFLIVLLIAPIVLANTYNINYDLDLKVPTNLTNCNLTIEYPNTTNLVKEVTTTNNKGFFNYTIPKESLVLGKYNFYSDCESGNFYVTPNGAELTSPESYIYILLTLSIFFLFLISLWAMLKLPYRNQQATNKDGEFIDTYVINQSKYIKLGMILILHALLTWFLNTLIYLSNNYLTGALFGGFVGFIFTSLNLLAYPLFIIIIVIAGANIIKDSKIMKLNEELAKYGTFTK